MSYDQLKDKKFETELLIEDLPEARSLRLSAAAEQKLPEQVQCCWIDAFFAPGEVKKDISVCEERPLGEEFVVDLNSGWEAACFKVVIAAENKLIRQANDLQTKAVELLTEYRRLDNREPVNLGFIVRTREDTFGPRLSWVKFSGKSRANAHGRKVSYTQPVKLHGKYRYSSRIFSRFPIDVRKDLQKIEDAATIIRFQVEKLASLRRLCLQPTEPS